MVYQTALRHTRKVELAQEVTQTVFTLLARKGGSLSRHVMVSGWLFTTTRFVSIRAIRNENRRQRRLISAMNMNSEVTKQEQSEYMDLLLVKLDDVIAHLSKADREAILARYFEEKSYLQVGLGLGLSEEAAKKRVQRAVEKMRVALCGRGTTITSAQVAATIEFSKAQVLPSTLALKTVAATAVNGAAGVAVSPLTHSMIQVLKWTKFAKALGTTAGLATVAAALLYLFIGSRPQQALAQPLGSAPMFVNVTTGVKASDAAIQRQDGSATAKNDDASRNADKADTNEQFQVGEKGPSEQAGSREPQLMTAAPFSVKGTIVTEVYQQDTVVPSSSIEESVSFTHSNGFWKMHLKCERGYHHMIPTVSLLGNTTDCENEPSGIRMVTSHTPPFRADALVPVYEYQLDFPPPERNNLFLCWLTFCPNPKLPIISESTMRRLCDSDFLNNPDNQGTYESQFCKNAPFLQTLCITNDGTLLRTSSQPARKEQPPYDHGFLEFEYRLIQTTNWKGMPFPIKSTIRKYGPKRYATDSGQVRTTGCRDPNRPLN
jgi:RNA polymerase sigma factor (sigma-70 family)